MKTYRKRDLCIPVIRRCLIALIFATTCFTSTKSGAATVFQQKAPPAEDVPKQDDATDKAAVIVVQGTGGAAKYQAVFRETCQKLEAAAKISNSDFEWIGRDQLANREQTDLQQLQQAIQQRAKGTTQLWIILVGHGTYDRKSAKFNLRGPDLSAKELNQWLMDSNRPVAIVNCSSASAPFINALAENGRVIVTATKSGFELNYARFGIYFADALSNLEADIDKDEQVSLLEAFLFASKRVEEFYKSESRLATEHALIDDNGDGKGTPLSFFKGVRVTKKSADGSLPDGPVANQIHLIQSEFDKLISAVNKQKRNELELKLEKLRSRKSTLSEEDYFAEFESIATELAKLYLQIEKQRDRPNQTSKPKSPDNKNKTESKEIKPSRDQGTDKIPGDAVIPNKSKDKKPATDKGDQTKRSSRAVSN